MKRRDFARAGLAAFAGVALPRGTAAQAAPAPELLPPGFFDRSHGFLVSPWKLDRPDDSMP